MRRTLKVSVAAVAVASVMVVAPAMASASSVAPAAATTGSNNAANNAANNGWNGWNGGDRWQAGKLSVVGLADGGTKLVQFDSRKPGKVKGGVAISGLTGGDTRLIGIDYRVQDGNLHGVGNNAASAGVYLINADTGVATQVTRLTVALSGTTFGVDFNPAANALRVVSDTGQNLRQPFATAGAATVADGALSYAAPETATGINGAAYTNNDLDPNTATTLFDLDTTLDQIAIQSPANAGSLTATGKLGVDAAGDTGFDIYSTVRDGRSVASTGVAVINGSLYEVALLNGTATSLGVVGAHVTDIAVPLGQR
ncbi:uncharacterized protein DUF4394 [Glaciihabitans tibetensis]|uniref:Uncharacterized protein DUF4394 n=1 Tax=Glaciihabitans tibetensis TaxID=1266600 RepID=A0A2T0VH90_9MICO|nr:DUF4394 domain-containing protein [Glaciihabitans tibetensis]PRY69584.1 uncharacterized protein DUF4394 [Glaciihabitans tibetensis]